MKKEKITLTPDKNHEPEFVVWDNDMRKYIGKRIAEMRNEAGLSQVQLAEKSGVGDSHIARIEMGRYSVGIDTLQKIADVFGKRIDFVDYEFNKLSEKDMNEIKSQIYTNTPTPDISNCVRSFERQLIPIITMRHGSGAKGVFIKKYTPTGHVENIMIDCGDGLKFHAPANEFENIDLNKSKLIEYGFTENENREFCKVVSSNKNINILFCVDDMGYCYLRHSKSKTRFVCFGYLSIDEIFLEFNRLVSQNHHEDK